MSAAAATPGYTPPLTAMRFVLDAVLDAPASWSAQPDFAELDLDTANEVLAQAGRFAAEVIAPLNAAGDLQGCSWTPAGADGFPVVTTPNGYPAAWKAFVDGGWPALPCAPEVDGQGLPQLLNAALFEMLVAANHAWTMYPGLLHGAYDTVKAHAVPELAARYLPKLVSGEWLATMNLTEPQAGSDLGLVRTRCTLAPGAAAENGAAVTVSGSKIFISGGEQDMTDNIVHLVLARLPDAPPGTKGLSLVLVPKLMPDGRRNAVYCDGIEKKMGIKGSATCQMRFDEAEGWLLGNPGQGLAAMFLMMNSARLHVGMQGLAHLEAATQRAVAYAAERTQLRAPRRPDDATQPKGGPDLIAWHPAMRRILLALQAQSAAARVLAYWTALLLDEAEHHPDAERRHACHDLVALLTPVVKGFLTDLGHRSADEALGVFGGYGFVHDYGIEQHVRDSRIAMIYEGTNEIQAIDLTMRKLLDDPRRLNALLAEFAAEVGTQSALADATTADADAATQARAWAATLTEQAGLIRAAIDALQQARAADPEAPLRVADDVLHGLGHALLGWGWARLSRAAATAVAGGDTAGYGDNFLRQQIELAAYGRDWLLPTATWRWQRIRQGAPALPWVRA